MRSGRSIYFAGECHIKGNKKKGTKLHVSYQEQWLDSTGPFKDVMVSMFATLARQESGRISERTLVGLRTARAKGKRLGRPPLPEATIRRILTLNLENELEARRIAKQTAIPLGTSHSMRS
jgi:DNA invertase Pin-like site-specific DNA recombinase